MKCYVLVECEGCGKMGHGLIIGVTVPAFTDPGDSMGGDEPSLDVELPDGWRRGPAAFWTPGDPFCPSCEASR